MWASTNGTRQFFDVGQVALSRWRDVQRCCPNYCEGTGCSDVKTSKSLRGEGRGVCPAVFTALVCVCVCVFACVCVCVCVCVPGGVLVGEEEHLQRYSRSDVKLGRHQREERFCVHN